MSALSLDDLGRMDRVRARRLICDSPLSSEGSSSVPPGVAGDVCDVDFVNGVVFVDFGDGAIACEPHDLAPAMGVESG